MRRSILVVMGAAVLTMFAMEAGARGGGGGGGGFGGGSGGFGGGGVSRGTPTGPSGNGASMDNSNGRFAQDRDMGRDRAEDRMSQEGLDHEQATDARKKHDRRQGRATPRQGEPAQ